MIRRMRSHSWFGGADDSATQTSASPPASSTTGTARIRRFGSPLKWTRFVRNKQADRSPIDSNNQTEQLSSMNSNDQEHLDPNREADIRINTEKVSFENDNQQQTPSINVGTKIDPYGFKFHGSDQQLEEMHRKRVECKKIWDEAFPSGEIPPNTNISELFMFATHYGISDRFRPHLWMEFSGANDLEKHAPPGFYSKLVQHANDGLSRHTLQQIELDIPRTFGDHVWFGTKYNEVANMNEQSETGTGSTLSRLRRILKAFAMLNPHVGYVQSMNFIAGFALTVLVIGNREAAGKNIGIEYPECIPGNSHMTFEEDRKAEEQAFWLLHVLVTRMFPGFYCHGLGSVRVASRVFEKFFEEKQPEVKNIIQQSGFAMSLVLPRWFLCLFLNCYSAGVTLHIWDVIFCNAATAVPGQDTLSDARQAQRQLMMASYSHKSDHNEKLCSKSIRLLIQLALSSVKIHENRFTASAKVVDIIDEVQRLGSDLSKSETLVSTTLRSGCCVSERVFANCWEEAMWSEGIVPPKSATNVESPTTQEEVNSVKEMDFSSKTPWLSPEQNFSPSRRTKNWEVTPTSGNRTTSPRFSLTPPVNDLQMHDIVKRLSPVKSRSPCRQSVKICWSETKRNGIANSSQRKRSLCRLNRRNSVPHCTSKLNLDEIVTEKSSYKIGATPSARPVLTSPAGLHPLQSPCSKYANQKNRTRKELGLSKSFMAKLEGKFFFGTACPTFEDIHDVKEDQQTGMLQFMSDFPCPQGEASGISSNDREDSNNEINLQHGKQSVFKRLFTPFQRSRKESEWHTTERFRSVSYDDFREHSDSQQSVMENLKEKLHTAFENTFVPKRPSPRTVVQEGIMGLQEHTNTAHKTFQESTNNVRCSHTDTHGKTLSKSRSPQGIMLSPIKSQKTKKSFRGKQGKQTGTSKQSDTVATLLDEFNL